MGKMKKFWAWKKDSPETKERTLVLNGVIAEDSWFGDEVTPAAFREELYAEDGNIVVQICSPGGDCFAAAQIYSMLVDYPGKVTVRIDGLAASAASVIAMAGDEVQMYLTSLLMVQMAWQDAADVCTALCSEWGAEVSGHGGKGAGGGWLRAGNPQKIF